MIRKVASLTKRLQFQFAATDRPLLYGNGGSIVSISQWWEGSGPRPWDYYVEDGLEVKVGEEWNLRQGMFRVVFRACLNDPSMNLNVNHLKKSFSLKQLIQLSAKEKQQLVENPSPVIIKPVFSHEFAPKEDQIKKNMLEIDKLFQEAVGLRTAYLIDWQSLNKPLYMNELKKRAKAVSADISLIHANLAEVVFEQGHKLQHVFLGTPYQNSISNPDLENLLEAMSAIAFKGKLILSGGDKFEQDLKMFQRAAEKKGFSQKLQYSLQTDGWYTMT